MNPAAPLLRLALIGPLAPPAGGMAAQTAQLAQRLREAGVQVDIVRVNAPYRPAWIAKLRGLRAGARFLPYLGALWRAAGQADVMHLMANSGWSWHLFAAPAIWIAHLRGTPLIVNYRGGEAAPFLAQSARWVLPSLRRATHLVVPSAFLREVFAPYGVQAQIIPNIIDLARFARPAAPRAHPEPLLLVARNLEALYDNSTAIRAFARIRIHLPQARLWIAGTGPERAALEALVDALDLKTCVRFLGRIEQADMPALYHQADLLLNPSTVDNMPISLLEALASRTPLVSTDVGGIPYLIEHERTGLLVPARDPVAMADAALRILRDPQQAEHLAQAGLAAVARYDWAQVKPRWLALYRACLPPAHTHALPEASP